MLLSNKNCANEVEFEFLVEMYVVGSIFFFFFFLICNVICKCCHTTSTSPTNKHTLHKLHKGVLTPGQKLRNLLYCKGKET